MSVNVKKAVCGTIVVCLLLSVCGLALAACPGPNPDMPKPDPQEIERQIAEKLDKLIDAGTITQDQSDRVLKYWREKERQRQADFEKMKDMSPDERKAYMDSKKKDQPDIIAVLTKDIGLSKEQAKDVAEAIRPPGPPPRDPR